MVAACWRSREAIDVARGFAGESPKVDSESERADSALARYLRTGGNMREFVRNQSRGIVRNPEDFMKRNREESIERNREVS
jgi:hypothetical protein